MRNSQSFRWPGLWLDPAALSLVQDAGIDHLILPDGDAFQRIRSRARELGLRVSDPGKTEPDTILLKGEWPGVHMTRGAGGGVEAGPTGAPWVDSNGWAIRLASALNPNSAIWVDAAPEQNATAASYALAIADAAAHGGRWIIQLPDDLARGIASKEVAALDRWKKIGSAVKFFSARAEWAGYAPAAVIGILSDFAGPNDFFAREMLNLLARAGSPARPLPKDRIRPSAFEGLRAVVYMDEGPPVAAVRKQVLDFVEAGGMLITTPQWGETAGSLANPHDRFTLRTRGKGRIAVAAVKTDDPYLMANDSVVLVSHRHDLVRFWNGGATGFFYTLAPDRKKAVVHLFFYADRGPDSATVRVAGRFRTAAYSTIEQPEPRRLEMELQRDGVEVRLPQVPPYVALQLEA